MKYMVVKIKTDNQLFKNVVMADLARLSGVSYVHVRSLKIGKRMASESVYKRLKEAKLKLTA